MWANRSKGEILALIDSAEVGRAKAEFLEALVQCHLKRQTLTRLDSLRGVVADRRLQEAEADLRVAKIQCVNARHRLVTLGLPVDLQEDSSLSVEEMVARVQFLGLPESTVQSIQSDMPSANLIPLISPLDGVVVRRDAMRGETAHAAQSLFVIADVRRMWLRLNLRPEDVTGLAIGQEVFFSTDGSATELRGTLSWISSEVDPTTRTIRALADIENPIVSAGRDGIADLRMLQANAYGTARIRVRMNPRALAVPTPAIRWLWDDSHHIVFVPCANGTSFQPRRVRPGIARDGYTEILSGLEPGEPVVVSGARLLATELADAKIPDLELPADDNRELVLAVEERAAEDPSP
jgi:cobalt-zinc-cadmium efflux system membrane fusion protein